MKITDWLIDICSGVKEMRGEILQVGVDVKSPAIVPINALELADAEYLGDKDFVVFGVAFQSAQKFKFVRLDTGEVFKNTDLLPG